MGTNYYAITNEKIEVTCDCGFRHIVRERLHIGKNSYGWMFTLHIIPERGICELDDWRRVLKKSKIVNEYGESVSYDGMIALILKPPRTDLTEEQKCQIRKRDSSYECHFDEESGLWWHGKRGREGNYDLETREFS